MKNNETKIFFIASILKYTVGKSLLKATILLLRSNVLSSFYV